MGAPDGAPLIVWLTSRDLSGVSLDNFGPNLNAHFRGTSMAENYKYMAENYK